MSPREAIPRISPDVLEALRERIRYVTRVAIAFFVVVTYLVIVTGTTTHEMLVLSERDLSLPLLDAGVDLLGFSLFAPLLLVGLHGYLLLERMRLAVKLRDLWPKRIPMDEIRRFFLPAFLLPHVVSRRLPRFIGWLLKGGFLLLVISPVILLLLIKRLFLPTHEELWIHDVMIFLDVLLVLFLLPWTYCISSRRRRWSWGFLWRFGGRVVILLLLGAGALWTARSGLTVSAEPRGWNNDRLLLERWEPMPESADQRIRLRIQDLRYANLTEARIAGIDLRGHDLMEAELAGADLRGALMAGADLRMANLENADLRGVDLTGADLRGARLQGARLQGALLRDIRLEGAQGRDARFLAADLTRANLSGADLAHVDFRLADLEGASLWAATLVDARMDHALLPDLAEGADLRGASLRGAKGLNLSYVDLRLAVLDGAEILTDEVQSSDLRSVVWEAPSPDPGDVLVELQELRDLAAADGIVGALLRDRLDHLDKLEKRLEGGETEERVPDLGSPGPTILLDEAAPASAVRDVHAQMVRGMVDLACRNEAVAKRLVERAEGGVLPWASSIEGELARQLLEASAQDSDCRELAGQTTELCDRLCRRWAGSDFCSSS